MDAEDDKEVVILGRVVRWMDHGIEYEADPKHKSKVLEFFGLDFVVFLVPGGLLG